MGLAAGRLRAPTLSTLHQMTLLMIMKLIMRRKCHSSKIRAVETPHITPQPSSARCFRKTCHTSFLCLEDMSQMVSASIKGIISTIIFILGKINSSYHSNFITQGLYVFKEIIKPIHSATDRKIIWIWIMD